MVRAQFARSFAVVVVVLICSPTAIVCAEDVLLRRAAADYGGEPGINHSFGNGSPLLPCPKSVPCLPAASDAGHLSPAVASAGLLPCPFSVPCLSTGHDMDLPVKRKEAAVSGALRPISGRSRSVELSRLKRANVPKTRRWVVASDGKSRSLTGARGRKAVSGEMALRGDAAYQWQARRLLTEVELKLDRLDRTRLDTNKSQIYAKASDFTREGFKALRAKDNLAALGFAQKAQVLSADLGA